MSWAEDLSRIDSEGCRRRLGSLKGAVGADFTTNDSLGLSTHPALLESVKASFSKMGATGSRLLGGDSPTLRELEAALAQWLSIESALVFNSGYHANTGILPALYGPGDVVFADRLCHASLWDGIALSKASLHRFAHNDLTHLETLLKKHRPNAKRAVIVAEALFSMDGDFAPLSDLVRLKHQFGAELYVDEAHSIGAYGPTGNGLVGLLGLEKDIDFWVGTFGKAFGSYGAFVGCADILKHLLINKARPFIFSTALPQPVVAWNLAAIHLMPHLHSERQTLHRHSAQFRDHLPGTPSTSHIVPVITGSAASALALADRLHTEGFAVTAIRHPTVPKGTERIRLSLTATHSPDTLHHLLHILSETLA
ncbi:MAG: aminotransferase class I/II-fold pyridoxal phosphate-dependent enzyme [Candidatus Margulisiibacteriota bacterium]